MILKKMVSTKERDNWQWTMTMTF